MKVEIIEKDSKRKLEEAVNEFLSQYSPSEIFDIKYSGCGARPPYGVPYYSAMIILITSI